jgi:hypothetical protein
VCNAQIVVCRVHSVRRAAEEVTVAVAVTSVAVELTVTSVSVADLTSTVIVTQRGKARLRQPWWAAHP